MSAARMYDAIPGILEEYLIKILREKPSVFRIRLVPERLGLGEVQNIVLEAPDGHTVVRVFGFEPVDAQLSVERRAHAIFVHASSMGT